MVTATIGISGKDIYVGGTTANSAIFGISTSSSDVSASDEYLAGSHDIGVSTSSVHFTEEALSAGETTFYLLAKRNAFGTYTVFAGKITAVFIDSDPR